MARSQTPAQLLAPGVWRIPVAPADGINAFCLIGDDEQVTLIDAGLPWAWPRLVVGLQHAGTDVADVTRILVTHAHADHVANAARVKTESGAPAASHTDDAEHLRAGRAPSVDPRVRIPHALLDRWGRYPPLDVDDTFTDGTLIDVAGGLRALHTPGHTPGHTSFVHEPTGVLITGDVIHFWRAKIRIGIKVYCHDIALNEVSAQRLADVDPSVVAFTHGPHLARDARTQLHAFLAARVRA